MRIPLVAVAMLSAGCLASAPARVILPADAAVNRVAPPPALVVEAADDADDPAAENVFADDALRPCRDEDELRAAANALSSIGNRLYMVDDGPGPSVKAFTEEIQQLLTTRCFELAGADLADPLAFDSGLSLKHWWGAGGGDLALRRYLSDHKLEDVTTPEQPRVTLLLDGNEKHALAPLLCPAADPQCGSATAGWVRRADHMLAYVDPSSVTEKSTCDDEIQKAEPMDRWTVFRACAARTTRRHPILPLGRFNAPTDGLFAFVDGVGNRCKTLRIYDLASGTRVRADDCSRSSGAPHVTIGRVPLASLREAVWMQLLAGVVQRDFRPVDAAKVPDNVVPGRVRDLLSEAGGGFSFGGHYSYRIAWTWQRPNKAGALVGQASGETTTNPAYEASAHAMGLFRLADEGFVEGCAPAFPRAAFASIAWNNVGALVYDKSTSVGADFASPDLAALKTAIVTAKTPPLCTTAL